MTFQPLLTITEKATFVAKDLETSSEVKQSNLYFNDQPYIEFYQPSKRLLEIMSEHEIDDAMEYLQKHHMIKYEKKYSNIGGPNAYGVYVYIPHLRELTRDPDKDMLMPVISTGVQFDKVRATLTVNGTEILLGRAEGNKTIQYWVCFYAYPKPNKAIEEVKILDRYKKDYGNTAHNRAVRDAVIALNRKIKAKAGTDKDLFIYSSGKVTYVDENSNLSQFFSVKI